MNVVGLLHTAYYNLLNGNVPGINVYKLSIPQTETGNFVWIYPEGGAEDNTKSSKNDNVIMRIDIVTRFQNEADQSICENADTVINELIIPTAGVNGLVAPSGLQVLNVTRESYNYIIEQVAGGVAYRKISRYIQRVHQI